MERVATRLVRYGWFLCVPALLAWVTTRYLVPPPPHDGWEALGWLGRAGVGQQLVLLAASFLLFTGLARAWRDRLPPRGWLAQPDRPAPQGRRARSVTVGDVLAIVAAAAVSLGLRAVVGQPYQVASASMLPTLMPGDTILVSKLGRAAVPRRGDVVVFRPDKELVIGFHPEDGAAAKLDDQLVKRVVGLPGDRIEMLAGIPIINGWQVPTCSVGTYLYLTADREVMGQLEVEFLEDRAYLTLHTVDSRSFDGFAVGPGEVFVLGDDRNASNDSRFWNDGRGAGVPVSSVLGQPWRVIGLDRDGRLDLGRFLQPLGTQVRLPGMDTAALEAKIRNCLKNRPKETWPPVRAPAQP